MATSTPKSKRKAKASPRTSPQTKRKIAKATALRAEPEAVHRGEVEKVGEKLVGGGMPTPADIAATVPVMGMMRNVLDAYAELPARLAECRSPYDVWLVQLRFGQRLLTSATTQFDAMAKPPGGKKAKRGT
jgi:hypothetical protein